MKRVWIWLLLMSLMIVGCNKPPTFLGGIPRDKEYKTGISLSPSTTEFMVSLFYATALVGRTASCNYPSNLSKVEIVAAVKPNYERIAKIKPDVIVFDGTIYNDTDKEKIKQLGIDIFEFNPKTIKEYNEQLQLWAAKIGAETSVDELVIRVKNLVIANNSQKPSPALKVAALMSGDSKDYMIAGSGSFLADVIRNSGADLVAPDAPNFVPLSIEMLIKDNPDIIITSGDPEVILKDSRLSTVKAVKNRLVAKIDPDIMLRTGVRVETILRDLGNLVRKTASKQ